MTLLEMTVVILVLMSLISILFIGATAWKRGSDRAVCILNLQNVQKGVRSFANLHAFGPGDQVTGLRERVIGPGKFLETPPLCPGGGIYEYGGEEGQDTIPTVGVPYANCSLVTSDEHRPSNYTEW